MEAIASDSDYYLSWEYRDKQRIYYSDDFLKITLSDDKTDFLSFMEEDYPPTETGEEDGGKLPRYCLVKYFMDICKYDAVNCATALLEGEACVTADPNQHFPSGMYPLHYAAAKMSYAMVDLLLRHGARTDVETTQVDFFGERCKGGLLPLNVALEKLSSYNVVLRGKIYHFSSTRRSTEFQTLSSLGILPVLESIAEQIKERNHRLHAFQKKKITI